MNVVIDTNILFSSLLKSPNKFSETIFLSDDIFHAPRQIVLELHKHQNKIAEATHLDKDELKQQLSLLLKKIHVHETDNLSDAALQKAYHLCHDIDIKDMMFVALAIEMEALLWTSEKVLVKGLEIKGFRNFYKL